MKLYQVIYADPPWRYGNATPNRRIENHYDTMSLDDICGLSIPSDPKGCVLFLWATSTLIPEALDVMMAWRFRYKSSMVWDKDKFGMGYWFRIQHELLMVGTRGDVSPPPQELRTSSVLRIPRSEHSLKPSIVREMIASWYLDANKLELFARESTPGWDTFGNEIAATLFDQEPRSITLEETA